MRTIFFIISFFIWNASLAQKRVELLSKDESVVKFVKEYFDGEGQNWKSFQLVDGKEWIDMYNLNASLKDSLSNVKLSKWAAADLNGDDKLDLIVSGKLVNDSAAPLFKLIVFMSQSSDDPGMDRLYYRGVYKWINVIPDQQATYPFYFSIADLPHKENKGLTLIKWYPDVNRSAINANAFTIDTLEYFQDYLINFNQAPIDNKLKHIEFDAVVTSDNKVTVILDNIENSYSYPCKVVFRKSPRDSIAIEGKIDRKIFGQLATLINHAKIRDLPNEFSANEGDERLTSLIVNFADGTIKKIKDYSDGGSYTLSAIYFWFLKISELFYEDILNKYAVHVNIEPSDE